MRQPRNTYFLHGWANVPSWWFRSRTAPVYRVSFGITPVSVFFDTVMDDFGNLVPVGAPIGAWK